MVGSDSFNSNDPTASDTLDVILEVAVEIFDTNAFNAVLLALFVG